MISSGAVSYETVLSLTPGQIGYLYECHQKMLASQRAAFVDDVLAAVGGSLGEDGFKAVKGHLARLEAFADGREPDGYTEDDSTVIAL